MRSLCTIFSFFKATLGGVAKRNERAIRNYCKDGKLQTGMMVILQQMPNCQQGPAKSEQPNLVPPCSKCEQRKVMIVPVSSAWRVREQSAALWNCV